MSALALAGMFALLLTSAPRPGRLAADATTARNGVLFGGTPAVGALFTTADGKLASHFCTASVVRSPAGNLLITAAHCLAGKSLRPAGSIVFAPGFHRGIFPYGTWPVTAKYVDSDWSAHQDPNDDVAFLVVSRPRRPVQARTGAEQLATGRRPPLTVQVIGYPDDRRRPIRCTAPARAFDRGTLRQLEFDCGSYTDGTSGGPFLTRVRKNGTGLVVGVIGGYQQGGDLPNISYSPQLGARIAALYRTAARH